MKVVLLIGLYLLCFIYLFIYLFIFIYYYYFFFFLFIIERIMARFLLTVEPFMNYMQYKLYFVVEA